MEIEVKPDKDNMAGGGQNWGEGINIYRKLARLGPIIRKGVRRWRKKNSTK